MGCIDNINPGFKFFKGNQKPQSDNILENTKVLNLVKMLSLRQNYLSITRWLNPNPNISHRHQMRPVEFIFG